MITVKWALGETSGIDVFTTDKEASRFTAQLMDKKLSLIGESTRTLKRFENYVYKLGAMHWRKRRAHDAEIKQMAARLATLQNNPLKVSITRNSQVANN